MSTAEALFLTPAKSHRRIETPAESARCCGALDRDTNPATLGGSAAISQMEIDDAWNALTEARNELFATPLGRMVMAMEDRMAMMQIMRSLVSEGGGCSRKMVSYGQADHLRRAMRDGATQTASEL